MEHEFRTPDIETDFYYCETNTTSEKTTLFWRLNPDYRPDGVYDLNIRYIAATVHYCIDDELDDDSPQELEIDFDDGWKASTRFSNEPFNLQLIPKSVEINFKKKLVEVYF